MPWKLVRDPQTGQMMLLNTDTGEQKPATKADMSTIDPRWQGPLQDNINRVTIPRTAPAPVPLNTQTTIPTTQETVGTPAIPASNEPSGQYIPTPEYKGGYLNNIPGRMVQGIPDALKSAKDFIWPQYGVSGGNPKYEGTKQAPIVAADQRLASKPVKPELPLTLDQSKATSEENYRENPMTGTQTIKEQPNDGIQRSTPQQIVYDYARRYQNASDAERKSILNLGFERDMANAMSRMVTSGSHKRLGLASPTFTTGSGEAAVAAAQLGKADVEKMEDIDPNSQRSKSLRAFYAANFPKIPISESMSYRELHDIAPLTSKMIEEEGSTQRAKLFSERQETIRGRLQQTDRNKLYDVTNGLKAVDRLRKAFNEDRSAGGPIEGRIQKILVKIGIASPEVSLTNANAIDMAAKYIRSISGVAVSEKEFTRLQQLIPSISQNPEQFEALLDNFEDILQGEGRTILDITQSQKFNTKDTESVIFGNREQPTTSTSTSGKVILKKEGATPPVLEIPESDTDAIEYAKSQGYQ